MENKTGLQKVNKPATLKDLLGKDDVKARLNEILGKNASTFATSVLQITQSNDMLKNAEPASILGAAMTAATLKLPLNNSLGLAYIVPFYDGKTKTTKAQFQIGAKGFRQLAIRSGQFKTINESDVREGELIKIDRLTGEIEIKTIQDEKERQSKIIIGYVSYFRLTNSFEAYFYMSIDELEAHAKRYSQTYKKGFGVWKDNFHAMALKTVAKLNLSKNAPLSVEMETAVIRDQAVFIDENESQEPVYADNIEDASEIRETLSDEEFEAACANIEFGNITKSDLVADYDLTAEQLKTLNLIEDEKA
jgi:recombination protein RecT